MATTTQFKTLITNKGASAVFGSILDEATEDELIDNFYYRYCCDDDDKFILFFQRNLRKYKNQYANYLRIEDTTFDPMVTKYLERKYKDGYSRTDKNTVSSSNESTTGYTNELNGSTVSDIDGTHNTAHTGTVTDNNEYESENEANDYSRGRNLFSDMPQANVSSSASSPISSSGTGGVSISDVGWTYATNMTDTGATDYNKGKDSGKNTDITTYANNDNTTTTEDGTVTTNNTNTYSGTGSLTGNSESNKTANYDLEHKEIYTGRDGQSPQEMLDKARNYITKTNALVWLIKQLDKCFMADFNYGEE